MRKPRTDSSYETEGGGLLRGKLFFWGMARTTYAAVGFLCRMFLNQMGFLKQYYVVHALASGTLEL